MLRYPVSWCLEIVWVGADRKCRFRCNHALMVIAKPASYTACFFTLSVLHQRLCYCCILVQTDLWFFSHPVTQSVNCVTAEQQADYILCFSFLAFFTNILKYQFRNQSSMSLSFTHTVVNIPDICIVPFSNSYQCLCYCNLPV